MGAISFSVNISRGGNLQDRLDRWGELVSRGEFICDEVSEKSHARVKNSTPIGYYGRVRDDWKHERIGPMKHLLINRNPIMGWLERGTKAHGPKTARALFIPLNQKAMEAGPSGVMIANASARASGQWRNYGARAGGGKVKAVKMPYTFGVDFLWAKRVKGIKARHIARDEQKVVARELRNGLVAMLKKELK